MNAIVWLVSAAFEEAVGTQAMAMLHRPSKRLANLTPFEVAQQPGGASIVLAELDEILSERQADR